MVALDDALGDYNSALTELEGAINAASLEDETVQVDDSQDKDGGSSAKDSENTTASDYLEGSNNSVGENLHGTSFDDNIINNVDNFDAGETQTSADSSETTTTSQADSSASEQGNTTTTDLNTDISLDQRHTDVSGGDFLKLGYALKGNDNTGNPGGDANDLGVDSSGLTNVAVLGPNTFDNRTYTLEISAESLKADWDLESADIVLKYDTQLFEKIDANDITLGDQLTLEKGIVVDDDNGLIRIAAASLSNSVFAKGDSIDSEAIFASINVDFDESYFKSSDRTPDANGKFTFEGNPLGFELSANSDETVFSRTFNSDADGSENENGAFTQPRDPEPW